MRANRHRHKQPPEATRHSNSKATMIDISDKTNTRRTAIAQARLHVQPELIERIRRGDIPKGDPLEVAKVAAVQSAKNTSQIIPYCHPLPISFVGVEHELSEDTVTTTVTVKANYKTGVEMEALTAAAAAGLTIYDMLKMFGQRMELDIKLLSKTGGKSDFEDSPGKSDA